VVRRCGAGAGVGGAQAEDAEHLLELVRENRFPRIWMPSLEVRNVRQLLQLKRFYRRLAMRKNRAQRGWMSEKTRL
jgi:hypothetical protein